MPAKCIWLLEHHNGVDHGRRRHFPLALGILNFLARVDAHSLPPRPIVANRAHVEYEGLLAWMLGHRPGVEGIACVVCAPVPVEESPGGHFKLSGRDDASYDLDSVAP